MLSYQVTYKSVSLIICAALRSSLRRQGMHWLIDSYMRRAAVKQKLDTNTEEGEKMRSPHTWLPPYPSFPTLAHCEALAEDGGSSALRVIILDRAWEWLGTESFLKSPKSTLSRLSGGGQSCPQAFPERPGRSRENVLLPWTLPLHP